MNKNKTKITKVATTLPKLHQNKVYENHDCSDKNGWSLKSNLAKIKRKT